MRQGIAAGDNPQAPGIFDWLDHRPVVRSWEPSLAAVLLEIHRTCCLADRLSLRRLNSFVSLHEPQLQAIADLAKGVVIRVPDGSGRLHPLCTVLLVRRTAREISVGLDLLLAALCEAAFEASSNEEREQIAKTMPTLRGPLDEAPNSRLQAALGDSRTLADIYGRIERTIADRNSTPPTIATHWRRWLRDRVHVWLFTDRGRLRNVLEPSELVPADDAPEIAIQVNVDAEPDDTLDVPIAIVAPAEGDTTIPSAGTERLRARAKALERASEGDLLSPPDSYLPVEIIAKLGRGAISEARKYLTEGQPAEAEPYAALALALAAGLRESDLMHLRWGNEISSTSADSSRRPPPRLSAENPVMHWPIARPPGSAKPRPEMAYALDELVDALEWPIPPVVHAVLRDLSGGSPRPGACVLPIFDKGRKLPLAPHDVVTRLEPGVFVGVSEARRAMASELARTLGPDVAQLAMGDTFSHSAAATHYSAPEVASVVSAINAIHQRWFGECAGPTDQTGSFGSRISLTMSAAREWPALLIKRYRSAVHRKEDPSLQAWAAHRDFLAAALCAATGHRPGDAIGHINLDQVIPEYGLIVLEDKQVDALRRRRIAATGARWTAALREYVDRLVDLSQSAAPHVAALAAKVLRSEAPLFTVATTDGEDRFNARALVESMPTALQPTKNHYRHRLNQQLQRRSVDPELRFAQMGWVVSPAHFNADLSPNAAHDLARHLGVVVDDILLEDGWFPASQRFANWRWDGVPMPALTDWNAIARDDEKEHQHEVKRLRAAWIEGGERTKKEILPRLGDCIRTVLPMLRLDETTGHLVRSPEFRRTDPVEIDPQHCESIIAIVRSQSKRPAEALETATARILLSRLLKRSHRQGLTTGALPWRPTFGAAVGASPFLTSLGSAVRHANCVRETLRDGLRAETSRHKGILTVLSVLCFSPYRDIELARAAVEAAARAARATNPGDWIRIPAVIGDVSYPMVLNGIPALLITQRGQDTPTAHAPTTDKIDAWLRAKLPPEFVAPEGTTLLSVVVSALRAAGRVELSGQERALMLKSVAFSSAPVERCLAADDNWPVRTREQAGDSREESLPASILAPDVVVQPRQKSVSRQQCDRLISMLNPDAFAKQLGKDNSRGVDKAFTESLMAFETEVGSTSYAGLLAGFSCDLARHGIRKRKRKQISVHTYVTRFAGDLLDILGDRQLLQMSGEDLRLAYLAVLKGKSRQERPLTLPVLRWFQGYLQDAHQVEEVAFDELATLAGVRIKQADPGIITDAEIDAVEHVLRKDIALEDSGVDGSPEFKRLSELRLLMFVLLEASGLRPSSVHGLLLCDLHLIAEGQDFVHVHRTGSYGVAKTNTSIGFVPLAGDLWARARPWVVDWLRRERLKLIDASDRRVPLFALKAGGKRRYGKKFLCQRIGSLLRWVCDDKKARTYWLRKRRVRLRHRALAEKAALCLARDVHEVLCISGHAGIDTPFQSYIGDPVAAMARSLREGRHASRADILISTRLKPEPLDVAWGRKGGPESKRRMEVVFGRLPFPAVNVPEQRLTSPPQPQRRGSLLPKHVDVYARVMQEEGDRECAALKSGLSIEQADALDAAATALVVLNGRVPWSVAGLRHPRAVLKPARRFKGSQSFFKALEKPPSESLQRVAQIWATRGFSKRFLDDGSALLLIGDEEVAAICEALHEIGFDSKKILLTRSGQTTKFSLRREQKAEAGGRNLTLMAAIEWVLCVVWIQQMALGRQNVH